MSGLRGLGHFWSLFLLGELGPRRLLAGLGRGIIVLLGVLLLVAGLLFLGGVLLATQPWLRPVLGQLLVQLLGLLLMVWLIWKAIRR
jgi:hypothetical protein